MISSVLVTRRSRIERVSKAEEDGFVTDGWIVVCVYMGLQWRFEDDLFVYMGSRINVPVLDHCYCCFQT